MPLLTDAVLAGVAIVLFANRLKTADYGGWPFALSGPGLVAVALFENLGPTVAASGGTPPLNGGS